MTPSHAARSTAPEPSGKPSATAANPGTPAVHLDGSAVSEAYKDVVYRFLAPENPTRFTDPQKSGFLKRLFGGR